MRIMMTPDPGARSNKYVKALANALSEKGCKVALFSLSWRKGLLLEFFKLIFYRYFKRYRLLHIHWIFQYPTLGILKIHYYLYRMIGLKLVWTIHNIIPHNAGPHDPARGRWLYTHADKKIIHYRASIPDLEKEFGVHDFDNLHVIPLPLFDFYPNEIDPCEARTRLSIPEDKKVLLCFGEVRKNRGCEDFVEALKRLGDDYIGLIVGRPAHDRIVARLEEESKRMDNLRLDLRFVGNNEIQVFFNACDVVVLPYTQVTTSGVAMLAFAFARPVIVSRLGSLEDVVRDDMGILVPPRDSKALTEAIKEIFSRDSGAMGRRALEIVRQEYSWDLVAGKTAEVYSSLL